MTDLLQDQIEYYSARAPEYDEWVNRQGRYDYGDAEKRQWQREVQLVRDQLLSAAHVEQALELAPGTGVWTLDLVKIADRVTAIDASPEMIAINRAKVDSDQVEYQLADIFSWRPRRQYDLVFFGFWLSHVPAERLSPFLDTVRQALKPGGRLFLVDSQKAEKIVLRDQGNEGRDNIQKRVLNDGRQFEIVKVYYDPAQLTGVLRAHGFDITVQPTPNYFIYADGIKSS